MEIWGPDKEFNKTIRKGIKQFKSANDDSLKACDELEKYVSVSFACSKNARQKILDNIFIREFGYKCPSNMSKEEILAMVKGRRREVEKMTKLCDIINLTLTRDSFDRVTYSFPFYFLFFAFCDHRFFYLGLTGIKFNAWNKSYQDEMTPMEQELWEYEKELAAFIDDEMVIEVEDIERFINILDEYIDYFYKETVIRNVKNMNIGEMKRQLYATAVAYFIYCHCGLVIDKPERDLIYEDIKTMSLMQPIGEIVRESSEEAINVRKHVDEVIKNIPIYTDDDGEKPEVQEVVRDEIYDYIENGRVTRVCDLEEFRAMLDRADLLEDRRIEYYAQMRNLIDRKAKEELNQKIAECKSTIFTEEDRDLYERAKVDYSTSYITKDIDAIIEMIIGVMNEEDRSMLMEELDSLFEQIRDILNASGPVKPKEEESKVVYYTEPIAQSDGEKKVPRVLTSILAMRACNYKMVSNQLSKLFGGLTKGDAEVKRDVLPCHLYAKGREYKVFYTYVGNIILIIDVFKADGEEYKKAVKLVKSPEFKKFLFNLQTFIYGGGQSNAREYTNLIMGELDRLMSAVKVKGLK